MTSYSPKLVLYFVVSWLQEGTVPNKFRLVTALSQACYKYVCRDRLPPVLVSFMFCPSPIYFAFRLVDHCNFSTPPTVPCSSIVRAVVLFAFFPLG